MDARNSAIAQQPLQRSAVVGFDADTGEVPVPDGAEVGILPPVTGG